MRKAEYEPDENHMERCKIQKMTPEERKRNFVEVSPAFRKKLPIKKHIDA